MRMLGAPSRYIQGTDVLDRIGEFLSPLGRKAFVFGDGVVLGLARERIVRSLEDQRMEAVVETFGGECSWREIRRLREMAEGTGAHLIVGVGGGKAADAAKALNMEMGLPIAIVPTIAATDAPTSHLAAIYDDDHVIQEILRIKPCAALVIVDTAIIAKAPVRFLVAGMGDALSTKFEAEACRASGANNVFGARPPLAALHLADLSYEVIREHGEEAKRSVERGTVTPALEEVVEANILLSGLGFESGGLAAAHAIHAGFTLIQEMSSAMHGEKVAFGVLVQLIMEQRPREFLEDLLAFYRRIGLPTRLCDLGLKAPTAEQLRTIAHRACREGSYMYHMPFPVTPEAVIEAMIQVEEFAASA
jgi:glycerol dehydrogenase